MHQQILNSFLRARVICNGLRAVFLPHQFWGKEFALVGLSMINSPTRKDFIRGIKFPEIGGIELGIRLWICK
ncbi:MAG: hypothetical protein ACJAWV_002829 [Flammeovirgaceae bacterium]